MKGVDMDMYLITIAHAPLSHVRTRPCRSVSLVVLVDPSTLYASHVMTKHNILPESMRRG